MEYRAAMRLVSRSAMVALQAGPSGATTGGNHVFSVITKNLHSSKPFVALTLTSYQTKLSPQVKVSKI